MRRVVVISTTLFLILAGIGELSAERRGSGRDVVHLAKEHLGTPYVYGGESPGGFDCSGLVQYVYGRAGHSLPRSTNNLYSRLNPVRVPRPGDLLFFRTAGSRVSHVGIYTGNYQFIHAPSSGKTVSYADVRSDYWKKRYAGSRSIFRRER